MVRAHPARAETFQRGTTDLCAHSSRLHAAPSSHTGSPWPHTEPAWRLLPLLGCGEGQDRKLQDLERKHRDVPTELQGEPHLRGVPAPCLVRCLSSESARGSCKAALSMLFSRCSSLGGGCRTGAGCVNAHLWVLGPCSHQVSST